jgi:hypothetical protein
MPSEIRSGSERGGAIINGLSYALRGSRIIDSDVIEDLFEIVNRRWRPADLHLDLEQCF